MYNFAVLKLVFRWVALGLLLVGLIAGVLYLIYRSMDAPAPVLSTQTEFSQAVGIAPTPGIRYTKVKSQSALAYNDFALESGTVVVRIGDMLPEYAVTLLGEESGLSKAELISGSCELLLYQEESGFRICGIRTCNELTPTPRGVRVGMSVEDAKALFPTTTSIVTQTASLITITSEKLQMQWNLSKSGLISEIYILYLE